MTREEAKRILYVFRAVILVDASHIEAFDMAMKALEQEPCEDAISRQAMLDGLASIAKAKAKSDAQKSLMGRVMFFTERLPSVKPQEPKTGYWIRVDKDKCKCDQCEVISFIGMYPNGDINYCPNCGAKMEREE